MRLPVIPPHVLDQLETTWEIKETEFSSHLPGVGPLVARARRLWNSIATRAYVVPMVQRQNDFNYLLLQSLKRLELLTEYEQVALELRAAIDQVNHRLAEFEGRLIDEDRDMSLLSRDLADLTYATVRLEQTLQTLGGQPPLWQGATAPEK